MNDLTAFLLARENERERGVTGRGFKNGMQEVMGETMTEQEDESRCVRGARCAARETVLVDGKLEIRPAVSYRPFCDADRGRIRGCLDELPRRYCELGERLGDKGQAAGARVSGGGCTRPVPINLGIEAFQRQLVDVVLSWEERVRDAARLSDVDARRRSGPALAQACRVMAEHVDALLALPADAMARVQDLARVETLPEDVTGWVHPAAGWIVINQDLDGTAAGFEMLNLHHRCLARLGWTPQHHNLLNPCWDCDTSNSLSRRDGTAGLADEVTCRNCPSEYVGERLRRLMVEEEQAQRAKHTKEEAS